MTRDVHDERGPAGFLITTIGLVVALTLVLGAVGFAAGWFKTATDVVSGPNVKAQHTAIIQNWQSLIGAAANACTAGSAVKDENSPTFVEDPALAYQATYRRIAADYNRRQANLFEAKLIGPDGYPASVSIPAGGTDWCALSSELSSVG